MGISTVAVYSQADKNALHVSMADESYCIGGAQVADSYLNMAAILEVAVVSGAQALEAQDDPIALLQSPIQRIISGLENASEGKADDEKVGSAKPAAEEAPAAEAPAAEEAPAAAEAAPAAEETATE